MKLRNILTITTLGIAGAIGGTCLGGLVSTFIFRAYSAIPNSRRWYLGNFSTVCGAITGALLVPYKILYV
jgi:hypothetical protein